MNKYAITTLLFGDKKYITGSIINAYLHKKFIKKYNLKIDLTLMLDENLVEYKDELEKYYDRVYVIKIFETKISEKTDLRRYTKIMKYLPNKAQMFNLTEYEKVLFTDVDFLPITKEFYTIFDLDTPAFYSVEKFCDKFNQVYDNAVFIDKKANKKYIETQDYNSIIKNMSGSINASLMLIKPSKTDYDDFLLFKKKADSKDGIHTKYNVDEILILTFIIFVKKYDIHCIPKSYRVKAQSLNNKTLGVNFASSLKPWIRLPVLQWKEENIWHIIAKKALKNSEIITDIYVDELINNLRDFSTKYKLNEEIHGFNTQIFKTNGKEEMEKIMNYVIENKNLDNQNKNDYNKIKYIMDEVKKLHSYIEIPHNKMYNNVLILL